MKTRDSRAILASVAILTFALVAFATIGSNWVRTKPVTGSIQAGASSTYEIKAYSSRMSVALTSTNGNMNVNVVIDGQTVYTQNNVPSINFEKGIGFGLHIVQVIIENRMVLGFRTTILVTGTLVCSLF